jgi:hypothetical protein
MRALELVRCGAVAPGVGAPEAASGSDDFFATLAPFCDGQIAADAPPSIEEEMVHPEPGEGR